METKPKVFISHITDEAKLAAIFKKSLQRDFPDLADVFVSSDEASISAGENWLEAIRSALESTSLELILCSKASVKRPWINFEAGAGWLKGIRIIPICHTELKPANLPMPLKVLHGIEAGEESGIRRLYISVAEKLKCDVPDVSYGKIVSEIQEFERGYLKEMKPIVDEEDQRIKNAKMRMYNALKDENWESRSLKRLALIGGISVSEAFEILQRDSNITFDFSEKFGRMVKLISR